MAPGDVLTLWDLVERRADQTPDATVAVDEAGRVLTAAGLRRQAARVAGWFAKAGVTTGDVVSWQLPTWLESAVLAAAVSRLGAIQNPIIPLLRQREVGFICRQAGSRYLVVPRVWRGFDYAAMAGVIAKDQPGLDVLVVDGDLPEAEPGSDEAPFSAESNQARWYFYTSGTTADPKGARHTDAALLAAANGMIAATEMGAGDRFAMVAPITHIGGIACLCISLLTGMQLLFVETFDPERTPMWLRERGVTLPGIGTPFFLAYLAAQRAHPELAPLFPRARAFLSGGAPKPAALHYELKGEMGTVGIVSGYGLTEAPILTFGSVHDGDEELANSEGRPCAGVELVLVDDEVRVKAPQIMLGYVDSSLDADAFDAGGYFRTGDLGRLDERMNLTITGRVKDIIIRNMENISAKELEDLLFTHPKVGDVAVVGVPDQRVGERACAVVVPASSEPPTLTELCRYLQSEGLSTRKLPEQLELIDALPRNAMGKVLKAELRRSLTRTH